MKLLLSAKETLSKILTSFEKCFPNSIPYIWGILSVFFLTASSFFVKTLSKTFSSVQILFFRSLLMALFTYSFMSVEKMQFHYKSPTINKLLIFRALAGTAGVGFFYYGISLLPLSDAVVIMQVYPVFTGILATIILGDKYEKSQLGAALVCLVGVVLIAQPPFIFGEDITTDPKKTGSRLLGTVVLLLGGLSSSFVEVLVKKVGSKTNVGVTTFVFGIIAAIISGTLSLFIGFDSLKLHHIAPFFWVGFFSFIAQVLKNRAFYLGNTGRVSNTSYFGIVIAYFLDIVVLGTEIDSWSLLGGLCILSCMFIYIYQLNQKEKVPKKIERSI